MKTILLATYPNEMEARLLADRLRDEGIPSVVRPMGAGYALAGPMSFMSHSVYVTEDYLPRARSVAGEPAC